MKELYVPEKEILRRISSIQKRMSETTMEAILILQRVDLLYFSGTAQSGCLFIPQEGSPLLMIKKYLPRAIEESPLKDIVSLESMKNIPECIIDFYGKLPKVIGLEFDVITVRQLKFMEMLFPNSHFIDASPYILETRMTKSPWEIDQMRKAADISLATFKYAEDCLKSGYKEIEFAGMLETFARTQGHGAQLRIRDYLTEGYPWHILSGRSGGLVGLMDAPASGEGTSPAFPCGAGNKIIENNEPVMIDFGTVFNGYHLDETRIYVIGSLPSHIEKACMVAIEIHNDILSQAKPGKTVKELFDYAVKKVEKMGLGEQFLGPPGYKVSFFAHGIGLELVEPPFIAQKRNDVLKIGMTLALEPKFVFPGEAAAGIESVFLVTEKGGELISKIPVKVFILNYRE